MATCVPCRRAEKMYSEYASVRVAHMAAGVEPVMASFNQDPKVSQLPYGGVSDYESVAPGVTKVSVSIPSVNKTVLYNKFAFAPRGVYTVVVYGVPGDEDTPLVMTAYEDDLVAVPAGRSNLRIMHLSTNLPEVDVYINNQRMEHAVQYGEATHYKSILQCPGKPLSIRVQSSTANAVEKGPTGRDQVLISDQMSENDKAAQQQQKQEQKSVVFIPDSVLELNMQSTTTLFVAGPFGSGDEFVVNQKQDYPKEPEPDMRGELSAATVASRQHAQHAVSPVRSTIEMVHAMRPSDVIGMGIGATVPVRELLSVQERSEKVELETGREYAIKVHVNGRVVSTENVMIEPGKSYVLEVRKSKRVGGAPCVELFEEGEEEAE